MNGCSHCDNLKKMLGESNISYIERDIDRYDEEYSLFTKINDGNGFVPAMMVFEIENDEAVNPQAFVPDRDFSDISEAVEIIKEEFSKK